MNNQKKQPEINPELLEKINLLASTPERDPELAAHSRQKFISEVENIPVADSRSGLGWLIALLKFNNEDGIKMNNGSKKFAVSTLVAILLVVIILFGGASATAYASQSALPGDALYPVKTSLEQTQIALANDAYNRAQLNLGFAQRRLDEITALLSQGRTNDVEFASSEFEKFILETMKEAQVVQLADPERGAELSKLVSQALLDYASALKSVLVNAPESVKPVVEKAMLASQFGAGDEVEIYGVVTTITDTEVEIEGERYSISDFTEFKDFIEVGDLVKVHVIIATDGLMVVREIELSSSLDDSPNFSGDDNSNDSGMNEDEPGNMNESGEDRNENSADDNSNDNSSGDDSNENESHEEDDDSNSNGSSSEDNAHDDDNSGSDSSKDDKNNNSDDDSKNNNDDDHSDDNENDSDSEDNSNDSDDDHNSNDSDDSDDKDDD